jgi:hypothetical protein
MTEQKPDVQVSKTASPAFDVVFRSDMDIHALIAEFNAMTRKLAALSALSGETETVWEYRARYGHVVFGEPRMDEKNAVRSAFDAMYDYPLVCEEPLIVERRRDVEWEVVK